MEEAQTIIPVARFTLPLWRKITFGFGGFGLGIIRSILGIFQLTFLLEVVEMNPYWAGSILFFEQICDSFFDLIVGFLSDNYPTRFGRRKPWIYIFSLPAVIFWVLSWLSPGDFFGDTGIQVVYYLSVYIVFSFCVSCVFIPYQAITPDIAPTPMERGIIVMIWQFFLVIGATVSSFIWSSSLVQFEADDNNVFSENYSKGYLVASVLMGILFFIATVFGASTVLERRELRTKESVLETLKKSLTVLTFFPFTVLCIMHCFSMLSITFFLTNVYLYCKYVLELEKETNFFILALQGSVAISLFLWLFLSIKVKKNILFLFGNILGIFDLIVFFFAGPSWNFVGLIFMFIARGATSSVAFAFPFSILPDVIEYYYSLYLDRREATFYSMMSFVEKIGIAFAFLLSAAILGLSNYSSPTILEEENMQNEPESTAEALRYLVSICPLILSLLAILASIIYFLLIERRIYKYRSEEVDFSSEWEN